MSASQRVTRMSSSMALILEDPCLQCRGFAAKADSFQTPTDFHLPRSFSQDGNAPNRQFSMWTLMINHGISRFFHVFKLNPSNPARGPSSTVRSASWRFTRFSTALSSCWKGLCSTSVCWWVLMRKANGML